MKGEAEHRKKIEQRLHNQYYVQKYRIRIDIKV